MNGVTNSQLKVIDSHTAGEPTRVVVEGVPCCGAGDMRSRSEFLAAHADWIRTSLTLEPRGAAWMVGAVLFEPIDKKCAAGVVFFNNTGYLGMCGHGLIGLVTTLAYLDRIQPGRHLLETPVGTVPATLHDDGTVSFENVVSYRTQKQVSLEVPGVGTVVGDVAYGGNWFFLAQVPQIDETMIGELMDRAVRIKQSLVEQKICGLAGEELNHVELIGPPSDSSKANARNFVLCPGGEYDRSPCGTGTSAKLACLAADGQLAPGEVWMQESILGGIFKATYQEAEGGILPTVQGRAFVTGETTVVCHPNDPFRHGFHSYGTATPVIDLKKDA